MWEAKFFTRLSNLGLRRYVQKIVDALNDCFLNLHTFNVAKLFSPIHYPINEIEKTSVSNLWLENLLDIFVTIENECVLYQAKCVNFLKEWSIHVHIRTLIKCGLNTIAHLNGGPIS